MLMDMFEWESHKSPLEGGIGSKRRRNSRACSPLEAPPRKDPRTGSTLSTGSRDGEDAAEDTALTEDGNVTEDEHVTEDGT
jgi:hypothetical protein